MARKKTRQQGNNSFAQMNVARAFAKSLTGDAEILGIVEHNLEAIKRCNGTRALDQAEMQHLGTAIDEIETAHRRIQVIGRRIRHRLKEG